MKNLAELLGFALLVAFLAAIWPPLALLGAGAFLVAWANFGAPRGRTASALGVAVAAFNQARRTPRAPAANDGDPVVLTPPGGWAT